MITIECDFCGKIMTVRDTKGISVSQGTVDIVEARCDNCNKTALDAEWDSKDKQDKIAADWKIIEDEKKNFLNSLLINQEAEFRQKAKVKHYGTLI